MNELSSQLVALNKMKHVTGILQTIGKKKTDDLLKVLHDPSFTSALEDITSSLDPSVHFRKLKYGCVHLGPANSLEVEPIFLGLCSMEHGVENCILSTTV